MKKNLILLACATTALSVVAAGSSIYFMKKSNAPVMPISKPIQKPASAIQQDIIPQSSTTELLKIQQITSDQGVNAWLIEDHRLPIISIQFSFVGAGSKSDPADKSGLSRLLSNTMDEGAGILNSLAFQKELNDHSINLSFNMDRDDFYGSLKTLKKHDQKAYGLLKMALTQPRFDAEAVDRMKQANMARIKSALEDPEWIAARIANDRSFSGHVYAQNSGGTLHSLAAINADDLRAYHAQHIQKSNLKIAVMGDVTADELKLILNMIFGSLPDAKTQNEQVSDLTDLQHKGQIVLYQKPIPQTYIQITQKGIDKHDPHYAAALVMNHILGSGGFGSRLMDSIREKAGLTYGIYSNFVHLDHVDTLEVTTSTKNETALQLLDMVRQEWQNLPQTLTEDDLKNAKDYLVGSLPLGLSSSDAIARTALSLQIDGFAPDYLSQHIKDIASVTLSDVQELAKNMLKPNDLTITMVGSPVIPNDTSLKIDEIKEIPNAQ
jgi:zinc protease